MGLIWPSSWSPGIIQPEKAIITFEVIFQACKSDSGPARSMISMGHPLWEDIKILEYVSMSVCLYVCLCVFGTLISKIWAVPCSSYCVSANGSLPKFLSPTSHAADALPIETPWDCFKFYLVYYQGVLSKQWKISKLVYFLIVVQLIFCLHLPVNQLYNNHEFVKLE